MPEGNLFPVAKDHAARAWIDAAKYKSMYEASMRDPEAFWSQHGRRISRHGQFRQTRCSAQRGIQSCHFIKHQGRDRFASGTSDIK